MKLQDRLNEISNEAEGIVREVMLKHKYNYVFSTKENALDVEPDSNEIFNGNFLGQTVLLTIDTENTVNDDLFFLGMHGNEHDCILDLIDNDGDTHEIDMLLLDDYTLCILADFLTAIKA